MNAMTFNDVLEIKNGKNQRAVENPNGRYPIYGSGGIMGYADDYICKAQTVIVGRKGSINNPIFVQEPFWNVDTAFGLEAKEDVLIPLYLFYFCKHFDFEKLNKAVTIPSLTKSDLLKIEIDLPSLSKQQIIVEKLLKIESIIQSRQRELQALDNLIKARFVEMFGDVIVNDRNWPKKIWNDVLTIINGKNQKDVEDENGEYLICGSGGPMSRATNFLTNENSVIIGRKGNINKPILMREKFWNVDTAFGLEPDTAQILAEYLYLYCVLFDFEKLNKAVTIPSLTKADLLKIEMPIPDLALQKKFSEFVAQVDKSKFAVQKALDKAQLLFDSLMQQYFG